jgi:hypothetical protein
VFVYWGLSVRSSSIPLGVDHFKVPHDLYICFPDMHSYQIISRNYFRTLIITSEVYLGVGMGGCQSWVWVKEEGGNRSKRREGKGGMEPTTEDGQSRHSFLKLLYLPSIHPARLQGSGSCHEVWNKRTKQRRGARSLQSELGLNSGFATYYIYDHSSYQASVFLSGKWE